MSALGLACLVSQVLAAGAVVDVSLNGESRLSLLGSDQGPTPVLTLALQPGVRAALEQSHRVLDVRYTPQLALVVPSQQLFIANHALSAGAELALARAWRVRSRVQGTLGDLDPGTTQRTLFQNLGQVDAAEPLAFAGGSVDLALVHRPVRAVSTELYARASGVTSPAANTTGITPAGQVNLGALLSWYALRSDTFLVDAFVRHSVIRHDLAVSGSGSSAEEATGGQLSGGWRRTLWNNAAFESRLGAMLAHVDAASGGSGAAPRALTLLPVLEARSNFGFVLARDLALFFDGSAALAPVSDPLAALLEERATITATAGVRLWTDFSVRGSVFGAVSLLSFGRTLAAPTGGGALLAASYAITDDVSLSCGGNVQARVATAAPTPNAVLDSTFQCGVLGVFTAWATGDRPAGSNNRPTRTLGDAPVGVRPPPTQSGPPPPPPLPEVQEPEPLTPERVPPVIAEDNALPITLPPRRSSTRPSDKKPSSASDGSPGAGKDADGPARSRDIDGSREPPASEPQETP